MFCSLSHDTDATLPPVGHRHRTTSSALPVRHTTNDPPALPPRVPIYNKSLSSQSCRQPHSRSSDNRSLGSDISAGAPSCQVHDNTLDVFIPLSSDKDEQTLPDGVSIAAGIVDSIGDRKQLTINSLEPEQTAFENILAECRECPNNDEDDSLDVVVGTEDETSSEKQPALNSSELTGLSDNSRESLDVSADGWQYAERTSRRLRPNVGRRLTRKETTKLSRKLTRKMSCRQQHALMMASEFDEFDELDVVVETGDMTDDDDGGGGKLSAVVSGSEEKNGDGLQDVDNADSIDTSFDERVTTKLQFDQLQVIFV